MDDFTSEVADRIPLANGVLLLWRYATSPERLQPIWDQHRGRCYDGVIEFPVMVHLMADALVTCRSGREGFRKNIASGVLEASIQAAYGKLGRMPVKVSEAFLQSTTRALREAFPTWAQWQRPASLKEFRIVVYDGKAIKRVAKRLKKLRGCPGGILGGRALVAIDWETGLAVAMHGDPDGEANDVKHVGSLVPEVKRELPERLLNVCDRGFCDLEQPRHFSLDQDEFLIRHHPKLIFHRDSKVPERRGVNQEGRPYTEQWGWIGGPKDKRRRQVRRIELSLPEGKSIVLLTSLLDPDRYPASEQLWVYRERWEIEKMFQKVTEVFGLTHLIGGTPQATLFQFAFCMVLYNMTQVVRGYIAKAQNREPFEISAELLFRDVARDLATWYRLITPEQTEEYFEESITLSTLKKRLALLLDSAWSETWLASPPQKVHRTTPKRRARTHGSVQRILFGVPTKKKKRRKAPA